MSLKIRMDDGFERRHEHAKWLIGAIEDSDRQFPQEVHPHGIAVATARHAITCDECGGIYWATSRYSSHIGCKGSPKGGVGF